MGVTPTVHLLEHTPTPEKVVAAAAKLCYSTADASNLMQNLTTEKADEFVNMLSEIGHESPFEHATITFSVEGISRACSHQLVRHRIASYSQQSQRYVRLDQFNYVVPSAIANNEYCNEIFEKHMEASQEAYDTLVRVLLREKLKIYCMRHELPLLYSDDLNEWKEHIGDKSVVNAIEKQCIEDARYVFPNACETKIVITMNVRALWNFFNDRCCNRAQWEIRSVAQQMLQICKQIAPALFKNCGKPCIKGICPENKMQCEWGKKNNIMTKKEADEVLRLYRNRQSFESQNITYNSL